MDIAQDPDELVSVEHAAMLTGIPARTLRNWIAAGQLPAMAGHRSKLLRLGDVIDAAASRGRPVGRPTGQPVADRRPSGEEFVRAESAQTTGEVSPSARSQLETIRDEWLQPLIDQIGALQFDNGRLTAECDAAARAQADAERGRLAGERARRDDADQADQLVDLLEDRVRELEAQLKQARR